MKTTAWKLAQYKPGQKNSHKCWRCGCHLPFEIATVDHLRPRARGGPDAAYNYRLCCYPCNQGRGAKPLTEGERRSIYVPRGRAP